MNQHGSHLAWLYILENPAMPGLVKVGRSDFFPERRASELSTTGVPQRYRVQFAALVPDVRELERRAHRGLATYHAGKEFFRCTTKEAMSVIRNIAGNGIVYEHFSGQREVSGGTRSEQEIQDAFASWAQSVSRPDAPFVASSVLFDAWLLARPDSMAEPHTMKMLVRRLSRMGFRRKKQGGTGVRGFVGLSLPAANGASA